MRCEEVAERLTDLLEGDLDEQDESAALEHISSCPSCEVVLSSTQEVTKLARDHGRVSLTDEDRRRMFGSLVRDLPDGVNRTE